MGQGAFRLGQGLRTGWRGSVGASSRPCSRGWIDAPPGRGRFAGRSGGGIIGGGDHPVAPRRRFVAYRSHAERRGPLQRGLRPRRRRLSSRFAGLSISTTNIAVRQETGETGRERAASVVRRSQDGRGGPPRTGNPRPAPARVYDLTLATRNIADVVGAGARVVNPFDPEI